MRSYRHLRRGQALVEFAVVTFVTTLLLAGMIGFGLMLFSAQVLQQAADVGAQELARIPLPPNLDFDAALADADVKAHIYNEAKLVLAVDENPNSLPLINRLLYPLYVRDNRGTTDPNDDRLHYPGTLARSAVGEEVILIPIVGARDTDGVETIVRWARVVEESRPELSESPFDATLDNSANLTPGTVALRINYPYQSAALVAFQYRHADDSINGAYVPGEYVDNLPVIADDSGVSDQAELPEGYVLLGESGAIAYSGQYGLGELQAFATTVRPFRRLITAQGVYRREVFSSSVSSMNLNEEQP